MSIWIRLLAVITLIGMLAACSGNKVVPTYEGAKLATEKQAVLTAGDNITVISVNGLEVPRYLLSNIEVNYGLKPGVNRVLFQYRSVWSKHRRDDDGARAVEVTSPTREVVITARAGDRLYFEYPQAETRREAEAMAQRFEAVVVNQSGEQIARSSAPQVVPAEQEAQLEVLATADAAPAVVSVPSPVALSSGAPAAVRLPEAAALPTVEGLKVLWEQASAEEKKAFLKWAFQ